MTRAYRRSLRLLQAWAIDRELFNTEATKVRARFDEHKGATAAAAARLVREAEEELTRWAHPDPYVVPYMPGGSRFMRNPAIPIKALYPDGKVPAEHHIASQDVHGIQVGGRPTHSPPLHQRGPAPQLSSVWTQS